MKNLPIYIYKTSFERKLNFIYIYTYNATGLCNFEDFFFILCVTVSKLVALHYSTFAAIKKNFFFVIMQMKMTIFPFEVYILIRDTYGGKH